MGKIFIIMGKSGTGKTTIYNHLRDNLPELKVLRYGTTRPKRDKYDTEYTFVTENEFFCLLEHGKILEYREYDTVYGKWYYFTYNDDINLNEDNYITVGTLASYRSFKKVFRRSDLVPIMMEVPNYEQRRERIIDDRIHKSGKSWLKLYEEIENIFAEVDRRMLADEGDFSRKKMLIFRSDILCHEGAIVDNKDLEQTKRDVLNYVKDLL